MGKSRPPSAVVVVASTRIARQLRGTPRAKRRQSTSFQRERADFQPAEGETTVTPRVLKIVANTAEILDAWEMFLEGQGKQVCPFN